MLFLLCQTTQIYYGLLRSYNISASFDNIRLYDLKISGSGSNTPKSTTSKGVKRSAGVMEDPIVPFTIVAGHHGGMISCLGVSGGWGISCSGTRGIDGAASTGNCIIYTIQKEGSSLLMKI